MHFTKSQIEEIRQRLAIQTKKDSEFPDAEIPLDGSERLPVIQFIPAVQDFENRLLSFADMRRMVLANTDMELVGCLLTINCSTPDAIIKVDNVVLNSPYEYAGFYGDVVEVEISKSGYYTYQESVTLTSNCTLDVTLNQVKDYDSDITSLQAQIDAINFNLEDKGTYYKLTVGDKSINLYSKEQVDAMLAGQGSGDATPSDPEEAFLNFYSGDENNKNEVIVSADGIPVTTARIQSNIPWEITVEEMPDEQQDAQNPEESTAQNVSFDRITLRVGDSLQIEEK